jgi:hypothetical protein
MILTKLLCGLVSGLFDEFRKRRGYALEDYLFEFAGAGKDSVLMVR